MSSGTPVIAISVYITALNAIVAKTPAITKRTNLEFTQSIGHIIHLVNGIGLTLLFGYVVLPISKRIITLPIIVYGMIFGIIEVIIAVWFGMLPLLDAGIAGLNIAPEVPLMTLVRHLVFGIVIGAVIRK